MPPIQPLALDGTTHPTRREVASVAIDTLDRFITRWEAGGPADLAQSLQKVWASCTPEVVERIGMAVDGSRARATVQELVDHCRLIASVLEAMVSAVAVEGKSPLLWDADFDRMVTDDASHERVAWSFTRRLFTALLPSILETLSGQHVSRTKAFFAREISANFGPQRLIGAYGTIVDGDLPDPKPVGPVTPKPNPAPTPTQPIPSQPPKGPQGPPSSPPNGPAAPPPGGTGSVISSTLSGCALLAQLLAHLASWTWSQIIQASNQLTPEGTVLRFVQAVLDEEDPEDCVRKWLPSPEGAPFNLPGANRLLIDIVAAVHAKRPEPADRAGQLDKASGAMGKAASVRKMPDKTGGGKRADSLVGSTKSALNNPIAQGFGLGLGLLSGVLKMAAGAVELYQLEHVGERWHSLPDSIKTNPTKDHILDVFINRILDGKLKRRKYRADVKIAQGTLATATGLSELLVFAGACATVPVVGWILGGLALLSAGACGAYRACRWVHNRRKFEDLKKTGLYKTPPPDLEIVTIGAYYRWLVADSIMALVKKVVHDRKSLSDQALQQDQITFGIAFTLLGCVKAPGDDDKVAALKVLVEANRLQVTGLMGFMKGSLKVGDNGVLLSAASGSVR